jgi:hypothetical protein
MRKQRKAVTSLVVLLVLVVLVSDPSVSADELYLVKKIYIAKEPFPSDTEYFINREKRVRSGLKTELEREGFVVVDNADEADAILKLEYGEEIVLDGEQPDPPKYIYKYELALPGKKTIWQTGFNVRTRSGEEHADTEACRKFAERLAKKIEKSGKHRKN